MKLTDFYDRIEADPDIAGLAVTEGETPELDRVQVAHVPAGVAVARPARTSGPDATDRTRLGHAVALVTIPAAEIARHEWPRLRAVITGQERPLALYQVTRIVGYFSRVESWNPSKLGELADRRNGNYVVTEDRVQKWA